MSTTASRASRLPAQLYVGALVLAASALLSGCRPKPQAPPPPAVTVAPALERDVADWDEFTGHFEAVDAVEVRPRVNGFVQQVAFIEGATVRKGDVLFAID